MGMSHLKDHVITDQQNLCITSITRHLSVCFVDIFLPLTIRHSDNMKYIVKGNTGFDIMTIFWTPLELYSDTVFKLSAQSVLYMYSNTILLQEYCARENLAFKNVLIVDSANALIVLQQGLL